MNSSTAQGIPFGNALPRADADQRARVAKPAGLDDVAESRVAVLTAGRDKHYAHDLAEALADAGESFDFICGNELDVPDLRQNPQINLLNLRGDQRVNASFKVKMKRVLLYYWRLIRYAATAQPKIFHILWNNKFEWFDRTLLMLFYRAMGKKIAFTAHNVNAGERDANDSLFNRLTLRIQYRLCDHIFVHTEKMKGELAEQFKVPPAKVSVIPYGINQTVPTTTLTRAAARQRLGLAPTDKALLFFGNIAPYKGLDYLVFAFKQLVKNDGNYRLVIAGRPKGAERYWKQLQKKLLTSGVNDRILQKIEYIPDDQIEVYFKAADVLVLPYVHIFQSGVLLLGYSFGLPVIATDVGSLREEIVDGKTGCVCELNTAALKKSIQTYFAGDLYRDLEKRRPEIQAFAADRYSWSKVAAIVTGVYAELLKPKPTEKTEPVEPALEEA